MELRNGRIALHLATLRSATGPKLLLLHALGGSSADWLPLALPWRGSIHALDLSGHGRSGRLYGGGYNPELWAADADAALAVLGEVVVVGAGISAYVALLLAGARPELVRAAVLLPGPGLQGAGSEPVFERIWSDAEPTTTPAARELQNGALVDPAALCVGDCDLRPDDYAVEFATASQRLILIEDSHPRPSWWQAIRGVDCASCTTGELGPLLAGLQDDVEPPAPAHPGG